MRIITCHVKETGLVECEKIDHQNENKMHLVIHSDELHLSDKDIKSTSNQHYVHVSYSSFIKS